MVFYYVKIFRRPLIFVNIEGLRLTIIHKEFNNRFKQTGYSSSSSIVTIESYTSSVLFL
jgi:hypothetical protein